MTCLFALALLESPASALDKTHAAPSRRLTLLILAGTSGRLVDEDGRTAADLVATVRRLAEDERAAGNSVVVVDAGRTLAPYAESRFDRGETAMKLLAASGCDAFAPGPMDFSVGRERLEELASSAPFPVLRPYEANSPLARRAMVSFGAGLRVEVVSVVDPAFAGGLAAAGFQGPLLAAGGGGVRDAVRVVVVHSHGRGDSLASHDLTWAVVEQTEGVDLVVDPDLGHDLVLRRERPGGPVFLVGRRQRREQPWTVARVVLELVRGPDRWRPVQVTSEVLGVSPEVTAAPDLEAQVLATFERFRQANTEPLPPAAPSTREELERFVLEAMREAARAEVAVLNRGALRPVAEEILARRPLPREAVMRLLSFDQELVLVELTGTQLLALAEESARRVDPAGNPSRDSLYLLGMELRLEKGGTVEAKVTGATVNRRPLRPDDLYRVVTTRFLAAGGDDCRTLGEVEAKPLGGPDGRSLELRDDVVLDTSALLAGTSVVGGLPYLGLTVDSEFRPGSDADGNALPRQLEESVSAGVTWTARLWPRLRLGLVGRHYAHSDRDDQLGLTAELAFLLKPRGRHPGLDARLLLEELRDAETSVGRADLDLRLLVPLTGRLALTPGCNAYLYDDSTRPGAARYTRFSLGLAWIWQGKHQGW